MTLKHVYDLYILVYQENCYTSNDTQTRVRFVHLSVSENCYTSISLSSVVKDTLLN